MQQPFLAGRKRGPDQQWIGGLNTVNLYNHPKVEQPFHISKKNNLCAQGLSALVAKRGGIEYVARRRRQ
jgi:hypothetical protein